MSHNERYMAYDVAVRIIFVPIRMILLSFGHLGGDLVKNFRERHSFRKSAVTPSRGCDRDHDGTPIHFN